MQRVAIARSLVAQPTTLLCDEPTGNLDSKNAEEVLQILRNLATVDGRAVVMVTHDEHGAAYGDRVVHLRDGLLESEVRNSRETVETHRDGREVPSNHLGNP
jgi:ABC-type lipoprotein export system ATPase subunit